MSDTTVDGLVLFPRGVPPHVVDRAERALDDVLGQFLKGMDVKPEELSTETLLKGAMAFAVSLHCLGMSVAAKGSGPIDSEAYVDHVIAVLRHGEVHELLARKYSGRGAVH